MNLTLKKIFPKFYRYVKSIENKIKKSFNYRVNKLIPEL